MPSDQPSDSQSGIPLGEMIEVLRQELQDAQVSGAGKPIAFEVSQVELELKVTITRKAQAGAKIAFWVVNAGGEVDRGREDLHTFRLTLSPLTAATGERLKVATDAKKGLGDG